MTTAFEATATFAPQFGGAVRDTMPSRWPEWTRQLLRSFRAIPEDALDRSTGLYNRSGLFAAAHEAMHARAADEPVSMVVLDFTDLREVWQIYGHAVARKVVARIIRRLRALAGPRGFAGRTGSTQFTVIWPGLAEDKAIRQVQRVLGRPARVEFDAGDSEIVLVPDLLVDSADPDPDAPAMQVLYRDMCRELGRIQKEEMRRLHFLTSERERHSRPMSMPSH